MRSGSKASASSWRPTSLPPQVRAVRRRRPRSAEQVQIGVYPLVKLANSIFADVRGPPAEIVRRLANIRDKNFLITGTRRAEAVLHRAAALRLEQRNQLPERKLISGAATDVINFSGEFFAVLPGEGIEI